ncbi:uncharacterized protein LOC62_01G000606 [Vanrija pseudolonga]|uniref:Uncharacterized protein n=1 Tax=Vanrija pseudolonga TaxID=143232 RepID=A0AAF1BET2_9TREE|nr:hypothetical protein LOC62_01G000606 [Vanrija pseudolonga]
MDYKPSDQRYRQRQPALEDLDVPPPYSPQETVPRPRWPRALPTPPAQAPLSPLELEVKYPDGRRPNERHEQREPTPPTPGWYRNPSSSTTQRSPLRIVAPPPPQHQPQTQQQDYLLSPNRTLPPGAAFPFAALAAGPSSDPHVTPFPAGPATAGPSTSPARAVSPRPPATLSSIPLGILHRILQLTLDPRATPERYRADPEVESARRLWWLFRSIRGVDRRFFLVATSIVRARFLPIYQSQLPPGTSSHPFPPVGNAEDVTAEPVFKRRSREAAVLDRFVAVRVGEDLRRAESELCEDSGHETEVFTRLQPAARIEDLLLTIPPSLITPWGPRAAPHAALPLPHTHLAVALSPLWAQLHLSYSPITAANLTGFNRVGRTFIVEVRRGRSPEETVRRIHEALEDISRGLLPWGSRVG